LLKFDDLVEVFTDKLVAKIPSSADGTVLEINVQTDEVCLVGHSLLSIQVDGQEGEEEAQAPTSSPVKDDAEKA